MLATTAIHQFWNSQNAFQGLSTCVDPNPDPVLGIPGPLCLHPDPVVGIRDPCYHHTKCLFKMAGEFPNSSSLHTINVIRILSIPFLIYMAKHFLLLIILKDIFNLKYLQKISTLHRSLSSISKKDPGLLFTLLLLDVTLVPETVCAHMEPTGGAWLGVAWLLFATMPNLSVHYSYCTGSTPTFFSNCSHFAENHCFFSSRGRMKWAVTWQKLRA